MSDFKWQWSSVDEIISVLDTIDRLTYLAVDVEIGGGTVVCIGLSWKHDQAICIPFIDEIGPRYTFEEQNALIQRLKSLFFDSLIVGQNFNHDKRWINLAFNIHVRCSFDTLIAEQVLNPGSDKDLNHLASKYCNGYVPWKTNAKGWNIEKSHNDYQRLYEYNCKDAAYTREVFKQQEKLLIDSNLMLMFNEQMYYQKCIYSMENRGLPVDRKVLTAKKRESTKALKAVLADIENIAGEKLNPMSAVQVGNLLYKKLKLKKLKKPTAMDTLMRLRDKHEVIGKIIEYRNIVNFRKKFLDARFDEDGRRRFELNGCGDSAFRVTSGKGGLQHAMYQSRLDDSSAYRFMDIFLPDDGYIFTVIRYLRPEEYVIAWEVDDDNLKDRLLAGINLYDTLAEEFLSGRASESEAKHQRKRYADIAERIVKGRSIRSIALEMCVKDRDVLPMYNYIMYKHPAIEKWHWDVYAKLIGTKKVKNVYGYELKWNDYLSGALPTAIEWIVQSTIALHMTKVHIKLHLFYGLIPVIRTFDNQLFCRYRQNSLGLEEEIYSVMKEPIPYQKSLTMPMCIKKVD